MCWFGNKDIRKTITTVDNTLGRIFKNAATQKVEQRKLFHYDLSLDGE